VSATLLQRGAFWVLAQCLFFIVIVGCGLRWHGRWLSLPVNILAVLLLLAAALCGAAGAINLGRNLTAFPKPRANARLVQTGIYALIRHPLYTAVLCAAFGWALLRASWPALLAALALAPFLDAKARREERWLRQQFPDYITYQQRVRRFIPWLY
jgi:protein-S-isoprenylcysteine O-methyltransferase Ste14